MEALFNPIKINNLDIPNRFAMAPMTRNKSPNGIPGQNVADYYERRAKGGVGLIITEGVEVSHPSSSGYPDVPGLKPEAHEGWRNVISQVHKYDSKIFCQLWHVGAIRKPGLPPEPDVPGFTPSGLVRKDKKVAYEMTADDVENMIEIYVRDIEIIKDLGFDGVELHGAHGYLIDQFFWEDTNQRKDSFGGSIQLRSSFASEIIKRARAKVGNDFCIAIRFSQWKQQDYEAKLAKNQDDLETLLRPLVDAGIDVIHASNRRFWEPEFEGSNLNLAGWTKKITGLPTITVGSVGLESDFIGFYQGEDEVKSAPIDDLVKRMDDKEFDMVAVGRALLSDPEWVNKVKEGRYDEVIPFSKKHAENYY